MGYDTVLAGQFTFDRPIPPRYAAHINHVSDEVPDDISVGCPPEQPDWSCPWIVTDNRKHLEWDGSDKCYGYVEWLQYLTKHFFETWGYKLNGKVYWFGDEPDDRGVIICKNSKVSIEEYVCVPLSRQERQCLGTLASILMDAGHLDGAKVLRKITRKCKRIYGQYWS